jgi:hypothetical protein
MDFQFSPNGTVTSRHPPFDCAQGERGATASDICLNIDRVKLPVIEYLEALNNDIICELDTSIVQKCAEQYEKRVIEWGIERLADAILMFAC